MSRPHDMGAWGRWRAGCAASRPLGPLAQSVERPLRAPAGRSYARRPLADQPSRGSSTYRPCWTTNGFASDKSQAPKVIKSDARPKWRRTFLLWQADALKRWSAIGTPDVATTMQPGCGAWLACRGAWACVTLGHYRRASAAASGAGRPPRRPRTRRRPCRACRARRGCGQPGCGRG